MTLRKLLFAAIIISDVVAGYIFQSAGLTPFRPKRDSPPVTRSFLDEKALANRDGYRYYGAGGKSSNSFAPTSVHKSISSSDHNYFVPSKSNEMKDMDVAGSSVSEMANRHGGGGNYLNVYQPAAQQSMMLGHNGMEHHYGDIAAESGHGEGGHGHDEGKGCNSALGLLGVLGLAAYLQNVLNNLRNVTGRRRRRDVDWDSPFDEEEKFDSVRTGMAMLEEYPLPINDFSDNDSRNLDKETLSKVMTDVFPHLSAVAHARDGLIPIHCTHSSVCLANQVLVKHLGALGHTIGLRISDAIAKLLSRKTKDERAEQIRMISKAGKMGRNGRNCLKVFPTCYQLKNLPTYSIPPIMKHVMAPS